MRSDPSVPGKLISVCGWADAVEFALLHPYAWDRPGSKMVDGIVREVHIASAIERTIVALSRM